MKMKNLYFIFLTNFFPVIVKASQWNHDLSCQELMISYIGASDSIVNESHQNALDNGTLLSTFDAPNLWMYENFMSKKASKSSILNLGQHKPFV
jgi:hypothetical protein